METKPIETTYQIVGDKVEIRQTTINVCNQDDLKNVRGNWQKQKQGLQHQLNKLKNLDEDMNGITDPKTKLMIEKVGTHAGVDFPTPEKLEVLQKQIDNLDNEIKNIDKQIK